MMKTANIQRTEMYRTFNCGVGMILVVAPENVDAAIANLSSAGETAFIMGEIKSGSADAQVQIV